MVVVCMPKLFVDNPLQAELLAPDRAMELCTELRIQNIIFEGDVLRDGNKVAHKATKFALSCDSELATIEEGPEVIMHVLLLKNFVIHEYMNESLFFKKNNKIVFYY